MCEGADEGLLITRGGPSHHAWRCWQEGRQAGLTLIRSSDLSRSS
ncbi:hypothetical protein BS78_06G103200 [Paspalum vaginatum]|nr:hypothetical protein BS78_06G103200 [Paspalum vaginatum]